jgi:hypothetical protein
MPNALVGVARVFYPMRDEQVARLGQLDRAACRLCDDRRAVRLRHSSRRDRCSRRIGCGFSGTAALELMAAVKRYPRPNSVRIKLRSSPRALRNNETWTLRLVASTKMPGQTRARSSSFVTSAPLASMRTIRRSMARVPSSTGTPSASNCRCRRNMRKRPNSSVGSAADGPV